MKVIIQIMTTLLIGLSRIFKAGIGLYNEGGLSKMFLIANSAFCAIPVFRIVENYIFGDLDFLFAFFVLLALDSISGIIKAWGIFHGAPNRISKTIFATKALKKLAIATIWLSMVTFWDHFLLNEAFSSTYPTFFGQGVLSVWISWSIASNLHTITRGKFPPIGFMKRLEKAQRTGNLKDILNNGNQGNKKAVDGQKASDDEESKSDN